MTLCTDFLCDKQPACSVYCRYYLSEHLRVQRRYTTNPKCVWDYSLLGIDVHVLYYFCVYLTLAYFLHGFSLIAGQSTKEQGWTPWEWTSRSSRPFMLLPSQRGHEEGCRLHSKDDAIMGRSGQLHFCAIQHQVCLISFICYKTHTHTHLLLSIAKNCI